MSSKPVSVSRQVPVAPEARAAAERLVSLAVQGLPPMFDPAQQLFCFTLKRGEGGVAREGLSRRYTMMVLLGLHRLEQSGRNSPIEIEPVLKGLVGNTDWIDNIGDLGVLLWLCAVVSPDRLPTVAKGLDISSALKRFRGARHGNTMELAWFLTGLSYAILLDARPVCSAMVDPAVAAYRLLIRNQSEHGIFGHSSTNQSLAGALRGGIGSFADQVYPIYAMAQYSQAVGDEKAVERALDCGLNICEAQGLLGQWWWHYDCSTGGVGGKYPVFSVHQHAMAPMTLFALGETTHSDFGPWIYKGLEWIGKNELGLDMEDASAGVIWRCLEQPVPVKYWGTAKALLTRRNDASSKNSLRVRFECRPYELGWLLYAFANRL